MIPYVPTTLNTITGKTRKKRRAGKIPATARIRHIWSGGEHWCPERLLEMERNRMRTMQPVEMPNSKSETTFFMLVLLRRTSFLNTIYVLHYNHHYSYRSQISCRASEGSFHVLYSTPVFLTYMKGKIYRRFLSRVPYKP